MALTLTAAVATVPAEVTTHARALEGPEMACTTSRGNRKRPRLAVGLPDFNALKF